MKTLRYLRCLLLFKLLTALPLLLVGSYALAQHSSAQNNFEVNFIKGCAPLAVTAVNTSQYDPTTTPIVWNMNWDGDTDKIFFSLDQSSEQADTVYSDPGIYKILQVIGTIGGAQLDTITIEVMEPVTPEYQVYNCINNSIYVDLSQEDYYEQFRIEYGDNTPADTVAVADMPGIVHQYPGAGTYQVKVEGIFENASTNCAKDSVNITTLSQGALEKAAIQQVEVLDQSHIQIDYAALNPNISYQLEVAENGDTDFSFATYELDPDAAFLAVEVPSDTRSEYYCFRIAAVNWCDPALNIYSDTICSIALQATAGNLVNQLNWTSHPDGFPSYQILRDSERIGSTVDMTYTDNNVQCLQEYVYQVTAQKSGMNSFSELLTLTANRQATLPAIDSFSVKAEGLGIALHWEAVPEARQYYVYREGNGLPLQLIDSVENGTTYLDRQTETDADYCYQVSYLDACGNESLLSIQYCDRIPGQAQLFFPTAFSPNGDGLNDVFLYKGNLINRIELKIFNRWGELVFHTAQVDVGWDGMYRGLPAPEGVYVYHVQVTDALGNQFQQQGSFSLLDPKR